MHTTFSHLVFEYTRCNMNTKSFYGRNSTLVTTLEEVNDIVEAADHVVSVVVLPPEAGDSKDTDEEDVNDNPDDIFEPAGQLEVEEEVGETEDESTRGKRRRLDSRWLQVTHFDTDIQPTLMPRNGDLMSLGEMSPYTIWQRFFTEDMIEYVTTCTNRYAPGLGSSTVDQVLKYTKYPKYIPSTSTGQVLIF